MTEKEIIDRYKGSKVIPLIDDIYDFITWGHFAKEYFEHSASWFYNKMRGVDGNGGTGTFNEQELLQLKGSLCDLADRIRRAADKL